jgi:tetratricopeptide (TPR) repeat protein
LPQDRRPSGIRLTADRGRILAHDGTALWSLDSGQTLLDFATNATAPVAALTPVGTAASPAEDWYQHGLDLEPIDRDGARAAYAQAVALAPAHAAARINLGRLLQAAGEPERAVEQYRAALDADPVNPTAAFNLGTALEATGREEEAIAAYRQALRASPRLADAHYNLSCLYQRTGHKLAALVHLKRYRELLGVH